MSAKTKMMVDLNDPSENLKGIDKYLERVERAKQIKEEKKFDQVNAFVNGQNW